MGSRSTVGRNILFSFLKFRKFEEVTKNHSCLDWLVPNSLHYSVQAAHVYHMAWKLTRHAQQLYQVCKLDVIFQPRPDTMDISRYIGPHATPLHLRTHVVAKKYFCKIRRRMKGNYAVEANSPLLVLMGRSLRASWQDDNN